MSVVATTCHSHETGLVEISDRASGHVYVCTSDVN